jgi:predicted SAM-dependent methyltransferase
MTRLSLVLAFAVAVVACKSDKPTVTAAPPPKPPAPPVPGPAVSPAPVSAAPASPSSGPHVLSASEDAIVKAYLANEPVKKLQVGAGHNNFKGWLNTDIEPGPGQVYLDAGARFPFPDQTFKYIYAEQLIEHLTYPQAQTFVHESFRTLAPGGRIRLATPNLLLLIALFNKNKTDMQKKLLDYQSHANNLPKTPLPETAWFNMLVRNWGHQFLYDPQSLRATLEEAGFKQIAEVELGASDAPDLQNIEMHWQIGGKDIDEATSMFFEATRP